MLKLRLKAIIPRADFRKSEETLYREYAKSRAYQGQLKRGEAYLFWSKSGNQLLWFFRDPSAIEGSKYEYEVVDSRKWRVTGGTWHPFMLANYAEEVGIDLIGIKRFEEIIDEQRGKR